MDAIIVICSVIFVIILLFLINNHPLFFREKAKDWSHRTADKVFVPEADSFSIEKGRKKAMLFVHGFPSTPSVYRSPGDFADEAGFDVFAPRMPGFGTHPDHLLDMNFSTWYAFLREYYLGLRAKYEEVHIVGTSMGGALTLKLAEEFNSPDDMPDTITTIAAPVFLNSVYPFFVIHEPAFYVIRPLSFFIKKFRPELKAKSDSDQDGYENWVGYNGIYPKQTYSLYMNLKKIGKELPKIQSPAYIIHARSDATVPYQNLLRIQQRLKSPQVRAESLDVSGLKRKHHCLFLYTSLQRPLFNSILGFIRDVEENYLGRPKSSETKSL
ncbi:MAG: alpha/beta fold hydrolase [Spirochaetales bacterium]|nr:alpha/beta fold hydrolase [Spirochaetales bacterium]